jgi:transposase
MARGINANIVHGWRKLARETGTATVPEQFVPEAVAPVVPPMAHDRAIEIELRRSGITVKLAWPTSAAMDRAG